MPLGCGAPLQFAAVLGVDLLEVAAQPLDLFVYVLSSPGSPQPSGEGDDCDGRRKAQGVSRVRLDEMTGIVEERAR